MMLDAIDNHEQPLSIERLYQWHRWLFPVNEWSVQPVNVGQLRGDVHIPVENEHLFRFKMNADSGLRVHHFRTPQSTNSDVR
ncbi:hypothetical protein [Aeromonas veronii]|uniref:hypothetical protein n=1 Tax=Aeromonas veronii TaxID=654 RepID=UPI001F311882|nr:hypothetical protein [Aeromonas veronii]